MSPRLSRSELRITLLLGSVLGVRMLGLFMLLPVLALGGGRYAGATPVLLGVALSIYGLTQAVFQIPFGWLSDKYGRFVIIAVGLGLFVIGSVMAVYADTIGELIFARMVQGAGAIGTAVMACIVDYVDAGVRVKANALVGMCIGIAFLGGLIGGPVVAGIAGITGIFIVMTVLGLFALVICLIGVPRANKGQSISLSAAFSALAGNDDLRPLFAGAFLLHCAMTACFMVLPGILSTHIGLGEHWLFYLPVLILAFLPVMPILGFCRKSGIVKVLMVVAIVICGVSEATLPLIGYMLPFVGLSMVLFFFSFNVLEAILPTLTGHACPPEYRGVAMGMLSTGQFLGTFAGGLIAGWGIGIWGDPWLSFIGLVIVALWIPLIVFARAPQRTT